MNKKVLSIPFKGIQDLISLKFNLTMKIKENAKKMHTIKVNAYRFLN